MHRIKFVVKTVKQGKNYQFQSKLSTVSTEFSTSHMVFQGQNVTEKLISLF